MQAKPRYPVAGAVRNSEYLRFRGLARRGAVIGRIFRPGHVWDSARAASGAHIGLRASRSPEDRAIWIDDAGEKKLQQDGALPLAMDGCAPRLNNSCHALQSRFFDIVQRMGTCEPVGAPEMRRRKLPVDAALQIKMAFKAHQTVFSTLPRYAVELPRRSGGQASLQAFPEGVVVFH